ncbi:hypothetical protein [Lysobacter sp.]|uniref:hypothetical protein n=1 Tax=Lysobacter sp. TaxID=72226 RepID=UPI002D29753F|nr:hypothetical protein [Lysobacter sp.]HZX78199.1 hypothetical protein [Lysobacter sp.]
MDSNAGEGTRAAKGAARPRSEVAFPYYNLDSAIEVAERIHDEAGGSCSRDQLAPMLGYSGVKNGGFLSKLGAARMFGLVEEVNGMLRPTQLAAQIYAPVHATDAQRAKAQAFLNVELFEKVYERFKGQPLPTNQGLENLLRVEFKVVPAQIKNAIRTLQESAESAGFFNAAGRGRLVMPLAANPKSSPRPAGTVDSAEGLPPLPLPPQPQPVAAAAGRAIADEASIPPAIYGLIRDLPPEGTTMSNAKRQRLIKAFEASINWLYPDTEEAGDE